MDFCTMELTYYVSFGKCDDSDCFPWEVELDDKQAAAFKKAVMTGTPLEDVPELSSICDEVYDEICEVETENLIDIEDEYTMECMGRIPAEPDMINELVEAGDENAISVLGLEDLSPEELEEWDAYELEEDELPDVCDIDSDFTPESPFDNGWSLCINLPEIYAEDLSVDDVRQYIAELQTKGDCETIEKVLAYYGNEELRAEITANIDKKEKTLEEIEAEIDRLIADSSSDLSDVEKYLEKYEEPYGGVIIKYAFASAVRQGNVSYVEKHIKDVEINDEDEGYCVYYYQTENEAIRKILTDNGGCKNADDYLDYKFSYDTTNSIILNFDPDFQREVFEKYLKKYGLTEEQLIEILEDFESPDDFERDIFADMESLGAEVCDDEIVLNEMYDEVDFNITDLLEDLGYNCSFEGESWKFETLGYYYIE